MIYSDLGARPSCAEIQSFRSTTYSRSICALRKCHESPVSKYRDMCVSIAFNNLCITGFQGSRKGVSHSRGIMPLELGRFNRYYFFSLGEHFLQNIFCGFSGRNGHTDLHSNSCKLLIGKVFAPLCPVYLS